MSLLTAVGAAAPTLFSFIQNLTGSQPSFTAPTSNNILSQLTGHHHAGINAALFGKIESAVSSALQANDSAANPTDVNTVIQKAIEGVLNNAADGAPVGPDSSNPQAAQATDQALTQVLQAHGISPDQFHEDFQAAMKNVQSGGVKLSSILQSLPVGSIVDARG